MTSEETANAELIVHLTATPSEELFIAGTDSKQLYTGTLTTADIQVSSFATDLNRLKLLSANWRANYSMRLSCWWFSFRSYNRLIVCRPQALGCNIIQ